MHGSACDILLLISVSETAGSALDHLPVGIGTSVNVTVFCQTDASVDSLDVSIKQVALHSAGER